MKTKKLLICSLFICLITAGAYIKIPVPPVPISMQLPFVILCGALLNRKSAVMCTLVYLIMGLLGLPVFSSGGGISYVLQPTFGYIAGFVPCAFIVSSLCEKKNSSYKRLLLSSFAGVITVHAAGLIYFLAVSRLYLHTNTNLTALALTLLAALPKDIVMCFAVATVSKRVRNIPYSN